MTLLFAPDTSFQHSKTLFIGRAEDLDTIISYLLSGNSVALYGERRIGKSFTLAALQAIISGDIQNYKNELKDETLRKALPTWQNNLSRYKAILITLEGKHKESELLRDILLESQKLNILSKPRKLKPPNTLQALLYELQKWLSERNEKLVIMIDEMEILRTFENQGTVIKDRFRDQEGYADILLVCTGAYQWKTLVAEENQYFRHFVDYHLKSINEIDLRKYLLAPLKSEDHRTFVVEMSGCKPLYAQYIGKAIYEADIVVPEGNIRSWQKKRIATDLLERNVTLRNRIMGSIYQEPDLDEDSKALLATLAHYPNRSKEWISKKLKLPETTVTNILSNLESFGTVTRSNSKYHIVGNIVETCGAQRVSNPIKSNHFRISASTAFMLLMIVLAAALYYYTHPLTTVKSQSFPKGQVFLEIPNSLETNEKGDLTLSVSNTSTETIRFLRVTFASSDIRYDSEGKSSLVFNLIEPGDTSHQSITYYVLSNSTSELNSVINIADHTSLDFAISRRPMAFKGYSDFIAGMLILLGFIAQWIPTSFLTALANLTTSILTGSKSKSEE